MQEILGKSSIYFVLVLFPGAKQHRSMDHDSPPGDKVILAHWSYLDIGNIYVTEATDFNNEVRFDLQDCLDAVVTSEADKSAHTI